MRRLLVLLCLALGSLLLPAVGYPAGYTSFTVACGTSSTTVLPASPNRYALWLQNTSDTAISVSFSGAAEVDKQVTIPPDYGAWSENERYAMPVGAVTCIHGGTGTKTLIGYQID